eukprot:scaffold401_cov399-Prasinococcus_capsulatus_cf.AAC.34
MGLARSVREVAGRRPPALLPQPERPWHAGGDRGGPAGCSRGGCQCLGGRLRALPGALEHRPRGHALPVLPAPVKQEEEEAGARTDAA